MRNKSFLEVVNVGQGDCMIMRPQVGCALNNRAYLIDTGNWGVGIRERYSASH